MSTRILVVLFTLLTAASVYATWVGFGFGNVPVDEQQISVRDNSVGRSFRSGLRGGK